MAGDGSGALTEELRRWVERRAAELDVSREAVVARALRAYQEVEEAEDIDLDPDALAEESEVAALAGRVEELEERLASVETAEPATADRLDDLAERVAALAERLEAIEEREHRAGGTDAETVDALREDVADLEARAERLERDLDEKITDVRERVVQVKREADGKAPADHEHPDLRDATERATSLAEDLEARLTEHESHVEEGFENFEEVLEYLTDTTERLESRADTLARAAIDLRERTAALETERSERAVADDIRAKANRSGDPAATCEACSRTVRLGLLSRPECPHCDTALKDVEPSTGLFGSATLVTGEPPALEGETANPDTPKELFEDE